nr:FAD-dependent oxidoreductase [Pseudonocardia endophytica]
MQHGRRESSDVVVVGAGPTGLALAGDLARAGVAVVVIESLPEPSRGRRRTPWSGKPHGCSTSAASWLASAIPAPHRWGRRSSSEESGST